MSERPRRAAAMKRGLNVGDQISDSTPKRPRRAAANKAREALKRGRNVNDQISDSTPKRPRRAAANKAREALKRSRNVNDQISDSTPKRPRRVVGIKRSRVTNNGNSIRTSKKTFAPIPNKLDDGVEPSSILGMSRILALGVVGQQKVRQTFGIPVQKRKEDYPKKPNFINLVKAVQKILDLMLQTSKNNISGNPPTANNKELVGTIDLKTITNVYAYLARKFGDLIHDLQSVKLLKEKLGLSSSVDTVTTFKKYIEKVGWLNKKIRTLIINANEQDKAIFEQIHGALIESIGGADRIKEATLNDSLSTILMRGRKDFPYITTDVTNIISIKTGQPTPSIVFDQTSKGSGPLVYGTIINMFPDKNVTQNLGLATMGDFAGSLPSSPERGYMFDLGNILSNYFTITKNDVWNTLKKFSLNVSPKFTSHVRMGDVEVQSTRLIIDPNTVMIRRQLLLGNKIIDDGVPLSADNIKKASVTITKCEHKTGLDFDLIVFAKSIGAIHSTGDVSACGFNQDLSIMGINNNFINETTSSSVTMSMGIGKIETKTPVSRPVTTRRDVFVVRMLTNVFGEYGFTPANIQKLSNAFNIDNNVAIRKRQNMINQVKNGRVQPGTIKRLVNSSKNSTDLRSKLEKSGIFKNTPLNNSIKLEVNEESIENKTTLNKFRASLKSKGVTNNAYINKVYTMLNSNTSRFQIMNSNDAFLICGLKSQVATKNQIEAYLQMSANTYARNRAKKLPIRSLAAQKTNTLNNNRPVANTPSNGKITLKNLENVGNVSLNQKSVLTVRIINNNKELKRKFGLLKTNGDEKLKNAFLKIIRTAKSRSILEKKLYKFFKVTPPSS